MTKEDIAENNLTCTIATYDQTAGEYFSRWQDRTPIKDLAKRIVQANEHYRSRHLGQMVAVVSHGGSLKNPISFVLGSPLGHPAPIGPLGNTALSMIRIDEFGQRLTLLNDSSHLDVLALNPVSETRIPQAE
jgi:broad specificity phosphatase PhoE